MNKKKWITYGLTGAIGLSVFAGGAAVAASSMDLRTDEGTVVPGGAINSRTSHIDGKSVTLQQVDSSFTVVSAPSARSADSRPSAPSPQSPDSPDSPDSPASPYSVDSPDSPDSPNSPDSPDSVDSVDSD